ncbi:hypothetical protein KGF57_000436 [Candida theae]|uniref:Thiaminase-2/PQQC domain-containing protein n=1 Tax=Candida theae TaxID=1198502 RepID=A0AAD5BJG4_9ASCO|nr:uncharacterized protein KGF57_000436 [Candida theae]KAI5967221.1 hypothetical protein KGF57_000436 [Candida theae]
MTYLQQLIDKNKDEYNRATRHPLTNELCSGTLSDSKLFVYLTQDLQFFNYSLNLLGKTLALCDEPEASVRLAKQIGFLAEDENTYFADTLKELESSDLSSVVKMKKESIVLPEVTQYIDYLKYLINDSTSYSELITFCYVMEKVYLEWVEHNQQANNIAKGLPKKFQTWIDLHSGDHFIEWVQFLSNEVERRLELEAKDDDKYTKIYESTFIKSLKLESDFFEACYSYTEDVK